MAASPFKSANALADSEKAKVNARAKAQADPTFPPDLDRSAAGTRQDQLCASGNFGPPFMAAFAL
jgi:hypothetical protein